MTEKKIPGYDREPITDQDWKDYQQEAERRGHVYQLFVDEDNFPNPEEGVLFRADSLDEAKRSAYWHGCFWSNKTDGRDQSNESHYPTHGYKLYHQGNLIVEYIPPNPEDVKSGKVIMPNANDVC